MTAPEEASQACYTKGRTSEFSVNRTYLPATRATGLQRFMKNGMSKQNSTKQFSASCSDGG